MSLPCCLRTVIFACVCALGHSQVAYAFGEQLTQQDPATLETGLYVLLGVILVLVLWGVISNLNRKKMQQVFEQGQDTLANKQAHLDSFHLGMLHLNQEGEVCYANKVAAYYFGKKMEGMPGQPIIDLFDDSVKDQVKRCLVSKIPVQIQLHLPARDRQIRLDFHPKTNPLKDVTCCVSMEDVTDYQQRLDHKQHNIEHRDALLDCSELGQITIDLSEDSYQANTLFTRMLEASDDMASGKMMQLKSLIVGTDIQQWEQGISDISREGTSHFTCRFTVGEGKRLCKIHGLVASRDDKDKATALHLTIQDMSELAEANNQQAINLQRFKGILSANTLASYLLDADGKMVACNSPFENLFNTRLSNIKDKAVAEIDNIPEAIRNLHSAATAGSGAARDVQIEQEDKPTLYLRVKIQSFMDAEGKRAGQVVIVENRTPLVTLENNLKTEKERFAEILDKAPVGIAMIDADDKITQANETLRQRLKLSDEALKKETFYHLFQDPHNSGKLAKQLHQTGQVRHFHAHLRGKDNQPNPSELHVDRFNSDQTEYLCWIFDISDEQFQLDRFEGLLQHSSMPMAVLGEKGFNLLNPAACEFFGIADESDLFGFAPYSEGLNTDKQAAAELEAKITQLKQDGRAVSLTWEHKSGDELLPCQATFVPMFKGQDLDSILCIWTDLRAIHKADAERLQAINLHQAAAREAAEKEQLLQSSQDMLADKVKSLAATESQLQAAQEDISEKESEISSLQEAHQHVTENLNKLQGEYSQNRELLAQSQKVNEELETQLEQASVKVSGLEKQRNDIANALQNSERQYKQAREQLAESEANSQRLEEEQRAQEEKIKDFEQQVQNLEGSIVQKDKQINEVSSQISDLQSQLSSSGQTSEKLRQALINQRKASEQAEKQRRELEETFLRAQAELSNKNRHVEHLQHEMEKFEELSRQEKGDMEKQQKLLQQELAAKQNQLQDTESTLQELREQAELDKQEKARQQEYLAQLQSEMAEVERRAEEQQQKIAEADEYWNKQQQQMQQELEAKQQQLQESQKILSEAKQQTEAEKAEKARQQKIFEQLQAELAEMEQKSQEQQQQMAESDRQWQERQQAMQAEIEAKQNQLQSTREELDESQRQADTEKLSHLEQQQKLEQLKVELADVESRASRQREMMEGNDEQWRQHHEEIEQQKKQLQQALDEARKQNEDMQARLQASHSELKEAESQANETKSGEQKLMQELNAARKQAEELEQKLRDQEQQESNLQQQLKDQQQALKDSQQNISSLQFEQQALTEELQAVREEYSQTKQNISAQDNSQAELAEQLKALEDELKQSKSKLDDKESALQQAQKQLQSNEAKLAEQEQALVEASKEELKHAQEEQAAKPPKEMPEFAKLDMPANPKVWFDLLPYLQHNPHSGSLAEALNNLIDEMNHSVEAMDAANKDFNEQQIMVHTRKLVFLMRKINSDPLNDLAARLESDFESGQVDNISIFWPSVKKSLMTTLRVIYGQLNA